jgi:pimeloyl-ACP methyl ester carboxylesterase
MGIAAMTSIYLLHGWAYQTEKWQPLLDELKAACIKVTLLRVPGLTTQPLKKAWNMDDYTRWLGEETKGKPVILIGHSNGGRIALNYAVKYPERVQKLVLIDSAGIVASDAKTVVKRNVFKAAAKTGKLLTKSPAARKVLYKLARVHDYEQASPVMRETMSNMLASDRRLDVGKVKTPTVLIWGRDDGATPLKQGQTMQQRMTNAKLHIIDGARHSPQFTHTGKVAEIIKKALQ